MLHCVIFAILPSGEDFQKYAQLDSAQEAGLSFTLPILPDACRRILDKKPRVREACAEASAQLYARHALVQWTEGHYQEAQKLNWIPQLLCEAGARGDLGILFEFETCRINIKIYQVLL